MLHLIFIGWERALLLDGGDDTSHFSNQPAIVGYKPSFTQNLKSHNKCYYERFDFVDDNEISDKNINAPNSTKAEIIRYMKKDMKNLERGLYQFANALLT